MATGTQWVQGARPRTLLIAVAPVVLGTGLAAAQHSVIVWRAALALLVGLAMQVGVNYANDYSDGVRGTDARRVGPLRLVGSGAASPRAVRAAAWSCFAVGAVAGLALAAVTTWWLLLVGAAAILAAWTYTGGPLPYGYHALGELAVFVFFGLVATVGTAYIQVERLGWVDVEAAVPMGLLACALLVVNNLRDLPTDATTGKRTLAVLLGERRTRALYAALVLFPFAVAAALAARTPWALVAALALPLAITAARPVLGGASGRDLIPSLRETGLVALAYATLLAVGLAIGG